MYTQCPHCHGIFRVDAQTLATAGGQVQCGECELTFDALASIRDELPGTVSNWENTELPFALPEVDGEARDTETAEPPTEDDDPSLNGPGESESPVGTEPPAWALRPRGAGRLWLAASVALTLALLVQFVFLAPHSLANHAGLRPVAEALCGLSGCEIPPRRDLDQLRLASRDVRAHPSVPGALIISATLVNEAAFSQPYPVLEITLGDLQGREVAQRRFVPSVYLPDSVEVAQGMAPNSRVQVSLEVVDPGESAVAFQFAFRTSDRS